MGGPVLLRNLESLILKDSLEGRSSVFFMFGTIEVDCPKSAHVSREWRFSKNFSDRDCKVYVDTLESGFRPCNYLQQHQLSQCRAVSIAMRNNDDLIERARALKADRDKTRVLMSAGGLSASSDVIQASRSAKKRRSGKTPSHMPATPLAKLPRTMLELPGPAEIAAGVGEVAELEHVAVAEGVVPVVPAEVTEPLLAPGGGADVADAVEDEVASGVEVAELGDDEEEVS